jgi:hypothetical protein
MQYQLGNSDGIISTFCASGNSVKLVGYVPGVFHPEETSVDDHPQVLHSLLDPDVSVSHSEPWVLPDERLPVLSESDQDETGSGQDKKKERAGPDVIPPGTPRSQKGRRQG